VCQLLEACSIAKLPCLQNFRSVEGVDPVQILDTFKAFSQAVVAFLQSRNAEAGAATQRACSDAACLTAVGPVRQAILIPASHCSNLGLNVSAGMDAQVDVALHTLLQTAPPDLYYHLQAVDKFLWKPWTEPHDAQFTIMLMVRSLGQSDPHLGGRVCIRLGMTSPASAFSHWRRALSALSGFPAAWLVPCRWRIGL
jgi:hypothetical protein